MSMLKPSGLKAPSKTIKHGATLLKAPASVATGKEYLNILTFLLFISYKKNLLKAMSIHYFYYLH